jgi:predicted CxxxxCH...CXXCH cytochrome family protein
MSPLPTYVNATCNNTYCHNPALATGGTLSTVNAGVDTSPTWTNTSYLGDTRKTQANCGMCHKVPGDAGFEPAATHSGMTIATQLCIGCHGHEGDTQGAAGQRHLDGIKYGGGNCDSCHAYDTGGTYAAGVWSGGTWTNATARDGIGEGWGAHVKHINHIKTRLGIATALSPTSQSFGAGQPASVCGVCHDNTAAHDTGGNLTGREIHFSSSTTYQFGLSAPLYNGVPGTPSSVTPKTCSNISCHFSLTPKWQ